MSSPDWLGPGLEIVSKRATLAIKSYARDRIRHGRGLLVLWAVAGGLFILAGLFAIGIVIAGLIALFSFLRLHFGLFESYSLIAGILFLFVLSLSFVAIWLVRRPTPQFPSLTSRLRVAAHAPLRSGANTDTSIPTARMPTRSALLFAAAAVVLTVAVVGRR
jgi:hypothetical protein